MNTGQGFFYDIPFWVEPVVIVLVLSGSLAVGYRISRHADTGRKPNAHVTTLQAAILGLLALVLSFTYSYVFTRLERQKAALVMEANAIGTAYLRADFAPEPMRGQLQSLLEAYTRSRVLTDESAGTWARVQQMLAEGQAIQQQLWPVVVRIMADPRAGPKEALLAQAVNEVIDLHTVRMRAGFDRLPGIVAVMVLLIAGLGMLITGYAAHGASRWPSVAFSLVLAFVIIVIADMDRTRVGFVSIDQQPLLEMLDWMQNQEDRSTALQ